MWSIRLISDASMGIPWMGSGAVGKAAFMLVRDVSVRVVMVFNSLSAKSVLAGEKLVATYSIST
jgi:hypothetical protein